MPQDVLDQQLRRRRHREVVGADQAAAQPVPVVEAIGRRQRDRAPGRARSAARSPPARSAAPGSRRRGTRACRRSRAAAPVSRAFTRPLRGSGTTRTPGTRSATSRVASTLALSMTSTSSGGRVCPSTEWRHAAQVPGFVVRADDDADPQRHRAGGAWRSPARVHPWSRLAAACDGPITIARRSGNAGFAWAAPSP